MNTLHRAKALAMLHPDLSNGAFLRSQSRRQNSIAKSYTFFMEIYNEMIDVFQKHLSSNYSPKVIAHGIQYDFYITYKYRQVYLLSGTYLSLFMACCTEEQLEEAVNAMEKVDNIIRFVYGQINLMPNFTKSPYLIPIIKKVIA